MPQEITIDVHKGVAGLHSKEYLEAVVSDALKILPSYKDRDETIIVFNAKEVAVILDHQARRGAVMTFASVEPFINAEQKRKIEEWKASRFPPFYLIHVEGSLFGPNESM